MKSSDRSRIILLAGIFIALGIFAFGINQIFEAGKDTSGFIIGIAIIIVSFIVGGVFVKWSRD